MVQLGQAGRLNFAVSADQAGPIVDSLRKTVRYYAMLFEPVILAITIAGKRDTGHGWHEGGNR
jgi:hypothetical protein